VISGMKVEGLDEAKRALAALHPKKMRQAERTAMRAAANVLAKQAARNAPSRTGYLRSKGIKVTSSVKGEFGIGGAQYSAEASVGVNRVGRFMELGTRAHAITARKKRVMRGRDGRVYGRRAAHPGNAARPFLRPAIDQTAGKIVETYSASFKKAIDRATRAG